MHFESWSGLAEAFTPYAVDALDMFREAEKHAPPGLMAAYRELSNHEQALLDFFEIEAQGNDGFPVLSEYLSSA